jgi:REP element-mobilizing transposase RayT
MGRHLRFIPPGAMVEITTRTVQGRWLLRPSEQLNDTILDILGRAQELYGVELHAFTFLSNHFHLLATVRDAAQLAAFVGYVNGNLARSAGQLHNWQDRFWSRRYRAIVIADEGAQVARLKYCLSQGCKEGLVDHAAEWPGVNCIEALLSNLVVGGRSLDRPPRAEAEGRVSRSRSSIHLSPIPCWRKLDERAHRDLCAALVQDIEAEARALNRELGRRAMGREWILSRHPHDRPIEEKHSPAPFVHATTDWARQRFIAAYKSFADTYREASERVRRGERHVEFPSYSFPPPAAFRHPPAGQRDPFWDAFSLTAA